MSVIQRSSKKIIKGTKLINSRLFVSSGIPSLDHLIGGGVPVGSILLLEEDILGSYATVLQKFFIAEGILSDHVTYLASLDGNPLDLISELPAPVLTNEDTSSDVQETDPNRMKIAWRYESNAPVVSTFGCNTNFGHHFDLSQSIDSEILKSSDIRSWSCRDEEFYDYNKGFQNNTYRRLLQDVKKQLSETRFLVENSSANESNIIRLCLKSVGSPLWNGESGLGNEYDGLGFKRDIAKFLYCLRCLIKSSNSVVFVSIPSHLFEDELMVKKLVHSADIAVKLESFAGSDRETNPAFKDYHGLFHIVKLSAINSLVPYLPPALDLAFKLRRKKFVIEKLHLPPELEESSEREQDDITSTTCISLNKRKIDF